MGLGGGWKKRLIKLVGICVVYARLEFLGRGLGLVGDKGFVNMWVMKDVAELRLLLVEDKVAQSRMFARVLEKKGFVVDTALSKQEAIEKISVGGYGLILLDIRMPNGREGIEVLEKLEGKQTLEPNGPIVMLTSVGDEGVVREAMKLGAASYMDKSHLDPDDLVEKVEGLLGLVKKG